MLNSKKGTVTSIESITEDSIDIIADINGTKTRAVCYTHLSGEVRIGDEVLLNTTAVELGLGTGGVHFVICNLSTPEINNSSVSGHIMKLRYTPMQLPTLSVEEDQNPCRDAVNDFISLDGMPVVCCELHSQIAPAAAAIKSIAGNNAKISYIMTDGAALPIAFSKLVKQLKNANLIDTTITCGQSFGGDLEAINVYSALIAAKEAVKSDAAIISQGPGNAGANTKYGFSGIEQGEAINAASILGGIPLMVLRISFVDKRDRHQGVSHHSLTVIDKIILKNSIIVMPELESDKMDIIMGKLKPVIDKSRHLLMSEDGSAGVTELKKHGINVTTMGRSIDEDLEFFLSSSACGAAAAKMIKSR